MRAWIRISAVLFPAASWALAAVPPAAPPYLAFLASGSSAPASQTVAISVTGAWTASAKAPWLSLSPASGSGPGSLTVSVQPSGMLPGVYADMIAISSGGTAVTSIPVTLAVTLARGASVVTGKNWYVSLAGTPDGDGSLAHPWDIVTAFHSRTVQPGDTIWLRDGRYGDGTASATIYNTLVGAPGNPIIIRAYPGERPIIDAWLQVGCCDQQPNPKNGSYVWFWGLEFASYNPDRTSGTSGPPQWAAQANHAAIDSWAPGTKVINCIVHDTAGGISLWTESGDAEAYGNITYNIGGYGTDRGHGHGFYLQNAAPAWKYLVDNITFNNFGEGIQIYGSNTAYVQNFHVEGNVAMNNGSIGTGNNTNNGAPPAGNRDDNLIIGSGNGGPSGIVVVSNYTYHTPAADDGLNDLSDIWTPLSNDMTALGNYFIGGREAAELFRWNSLVFQNNTLYSRDDDDVSLFWDPSQNPASYAWDNNTYYGSGHFTVYPGCATASCSNGRTLSFGDWQSSVGVDAHSTMNSGPPSGLWVFVRPNIYEPGRANIVIYNWNLQSTVPVDLSQAGVQPGDPFEIRDGENWPAGPILSGTYNGGTVSIPMTGLKVALPNGVVPNPQPHTAPQFGVFVVRSGSQYAPRQRTGSTPPPQPRPQARP